MEEIKEYFIGELINLGFTKRSDIQDTIYEMKCKNWNSIDMIQFEDTNGIIYFRAYGKSANGYEIGMSHTDSYFGVNEICRAMGIGFDKYIKDVLTKMDDKMYEFKLK